MNNEWRDIPELSEYEFLKGVGVRHKKTKEMVEIKKQKGNGLRYSVVTQDESNGDNRRGLLSMAIAIDK